MTLLSTTEPGRTWVRFHRPSGLLRHQPRSARGAPGPPAPPRGRAAGTTSPGYPPHTSRATNWPHRKTAAPSTTAAPHSPAPNMRFAAERTDPAQIPRSPAVYLCTADRQGHYATCTISFTRARG